LKFSNKGINRLIYPITFFNPVILLGNTWYKN
jgi:hypothetical protein